MRRKKAAGMKYSPPVILDRVKVRAFALRKYSKFEQANLMAYLFE